MSQTDTSTATQTAPFARFSISEDWLATIAGLVIVVILGLLITGPAPQNVVLTAPIGEMVTVTALPQNGWSVSAKLDGQNTAIQGATTDLAGGQVYVYRCENDQITLQEQAELPAGVEAPDAAHARLVLINGCTRQAVLTYKTGNIIPWPVFRLFGR